MAVRLVSAERKDTRVLSGEEGGGWEEGGKQGGRREGGRWKMGGGEGKEMRKGEKERFEEGKGEHGLNELEMSQCVMPRDNSSVGCCVN